MNSRTDTGFEDIPSFSSRRISLSLSRFSTANEAALTFSAHLRLHHPIHIAQIPNVQYKEARIRIALTASASALSLVDALFI